MTHSRLSPSSAARRVQCPGSLNLAQHCEPLGDTTAAKEGELAHYVAAEYLRSKVSECQIKNIFSVIQTSIPNGETITEEMIEGAKFYADYILEQVSSHHPFQIEQLTAISQIHPDCFGTPDCWVYDSDKKTLFIFDYKFGHTPITAFENWQLIEYAAGIVNIHNNNVPVCKIQFTIIQPRNFNENGKINTWFLDSTDLLKPYFEQLRQAEILATQPNAPCRTGPECHYCPARLVCQTLQSAVLTAVDRSCVNDPLDISPQHIGAELRYLLRSKKLLDARITALSEYATHGLNKGQPIPYFKLSSGRGTQQWSVPIEKITELGELLDIPVVKPTTLITPKQAIKAGFPEEVIKEFSTEYEGKTELTLVDEKEVRKIFFTSNF